MHIVKKLCKRTTRSQELLVHAAQTLKTKQPSVLTLKSKTHRHAAVGYSVKDKVRHVANQRYRYNIAKTIASISMRKQRCRMLTHLRLSPRPLS